MFKLLKKLRKDDNGATAIEYGLIAALVSIAAIVALNAVGDSLTSVFDKVSTDLDSSVTTTT